MQTINDKQKYKLQQLFEMLSVSLDIGMESFSPLVKSEIVSVCIGLIYDKLHI